MYTTNQKMALATGIMLGCDVKLYANEALSNEVMWALLELQCLGVDCKDIATGAYSVNEIVKIAIYRTVGIDIKSYVDKEEYMAEQLDLIAVGNIINITDERVYNPAYDEDTMISILMNIAIGKSVEEAIAIGDGIDVGNSLEEIEIGFDTAMTIGMFQERVSKSYDKLRKRSKEVKEEAEKRVGEVADIVNDMDKKLWVIE